MMTRWRINPHGRFYPQTVDLTLSECRFKAQHFVEDVMTPLVQTVISQGKTRYAPRLNVHLDNCRVHFSKVTEQFLIENQLLHVPHPPYSPHFAPSDFWLFGLIKTGLAREAWPSPINYEKVFENFWREFLPRNRRRSSGAGLTE
jgi:hypothetical protein